MKTLIRATVAIMLFLPLLAMSPASAATTTHTGTMHLLLLQDNPNINVSHAISTGVIHARGKDESGAKNTDNITFPAGTIRLQQHDTKEHLHFDKTTCLFTASNVGTFKILGGTKAYAHIKGHGTVTVQVYAIGCDQSKAPIFFQLTIKAVGKVSY